MTLLPLARPKIDKTLLEAVFKTVGVTQAVRILGVRGFFAGMENRRNEFDDAIFLETPTIVLGFNANTDPTGYRPGHGTGSVKGLATLKEGVWMFEIGMHKGRYPALVQKGPVTVLRDADETVMPQHLVVRDGINMYEDTGHFGIQIHCSGWANTGSMGCQTIYPSQWDEFMNTCHGAMMDAKQTTVPYVLLENSKVLA